ncbi:arylesterase [Geoalkalibacter sp.]|uniref:arylesterase n=1 Tax=Geoalkalibacter sp. TaxID=3041440 RepID=UPI00272E1D81|nr:arylesterase [Geoalkalibacter sp.]
MRTFLSVMFLAMLLFLPCNAQAARDNLRLTVLGDSLAAGYGLAPDEAFPARLEEALRQAGCPVRVINAGVSGDTTAGGLARLEWALADAPHIVLVELGGNDALRGLAPEHTQANLDAILGRLKERGVQPILAGMLAPRNLGRDYYSAFDGIYPHLAEKHGVPLYPFFLEGVAGVPELNLPDGIHPNAQGIDEIVRRILPLVKDVARRQKGEVQ